MAMIPHMNELHKKYRDKGLLVHGMNVMENDLAAVKAAVKNKKIAYPVAFTGGNKSAFDREWLQPAGISGIPVAFVVIDGKLVRITHPRGLTDSAIEEWLAAAAKSVPPPPPEIRQAAVILKEFQNAQSSGNTALMKSLVDELQKSNPKAPDLPEMKVELLVAGKEWSEAAQAIEVMAEDPAGIQLLTKFIQKAVTDENGIYPAEWLVMLANTHQYNRKPKGLGAMDHVGLSMLYWRAGDRDKALQHAKDAASRAESEAAEKPDPATVACFAKFAESVAAGKMPSMKDFHASMPRKSE